MKKIEASSLNELLFISNPLLSPQERYLAYRQARVDWDKNSYPAKIMLYDRIKVRHLALTSEAIGKLFRFIDENTMSFTAERESTHKRPGEKTELYRIALDGGEAQLWLSLPFELENYYVLTGGDLILQVAETPDSRALAVVASDTEKEALRKKQEDEQDYHLVTEIPFWANAACYNSEHRSRLYHYSTTAEKALPFTAEDVSCEIVDVDLKRGRVLFLQESRPEGVLELYNRLFLFDLGDTTTTEIVPEKPLNFSKAAFAGEDVIFTAADMEKYGLNEDGYTYLWRAKDGKVSLLSRDIVNGNSVGTDVLLGDGREYQGSDDGLYYLATEGSSSYLKFMDKEGRTKRLTSQEGAVTAFAQGKSVLFLTALRGLAGQEVYELKEGIETAITESSRCLSGYRLSKIERFHFNSGEDVLEAFVLKPADYQEGKKYPAVLQIHGGPKTVFGTVLHLEMQLLAAQGYFVFYTNPRGSDGRGRDWADIRGDYGGRDYANLMSLTDAVLERYPAIEESRLAVMGGSYGGFMTNWIIGHTARFKTAVTERSISNWFSMYGISDIGYYFASDQTDADPWKNTNRMWAKSPLKYVNEMKTPTLIIHSDADYRCPLAEAQQLFTALKLRKIETRMLIFKGENHELSRSGKVKHRLRRLEEILKWYRETL